MKRLLLISVITATMLAMGCASGGGNETRIKTPAQLDNGALAWRDGDFGKAAEELDLARRVCGDALLGRQATLLLASLYIDPRNPARDFDRAAELSAMYLKLPETFPWTRPLAATIYLLALDSGARVPDLSDQAKATDPANVPEGCNPKDLHANPTPLAQLPTLDAATYPQTNARLSQRVRELEEELERVRATVSP